MAITMLYGDPVKDATYAIVGDTNGAIYTVRALTGAGSWLLPNLPKAAPVGTSVLYFPVAVDLINPVLVPVDATQPVLVPARLRRVSFRQVTDPVSLVQFSAGHDNATDTWWVTPTVALTPPTPTDPPTPPDTTVTITPL